MTRRIKTPKTDQPATPEVFSDIMRSAQGLFTTTNPAMQPQIEQFWDAQEKMLREAEDFTRHWFGRRHLATRTALDAVKQAASQKDTDPAALMQAMSDWQKHSIERMTEDAREWLDMMSRCTRQVIEAEVDAGGEVIEKATQQAARTRKPKSSIPV